MARAKLLRAFSTSSSAKCTLDKPSQAKLWLMDLIGVAAAGHAPRRSQHAKAAHTLRVVGGRGENPLGRDDQQYNGDETNPSIEQLHRQSVREPGCDAGDRGVEGLALREGEGDTRHRDRCAEQDAGHPVADDGERSPRVASALRTWSSNRSMAVSQSCSSDCRG